MSSVGKCVMESLKASHSETWKKTCQTFQSVLYLLMSSVFEIVLRALVDIRSTNELTFGGPVLIVVDQRNMSITKMI